MYPWLYGINFRHKPEGEGEQMHSWPLGDFRGGQAPFTPVPHFRGHCIKLTIRMFVCYRQTWFPCGLPRRMIHIPNQHGPGSALVHN